MSLGFRQICQGFLPYSYNINIVNWDYFNLIYNMYTVYVEHLVVTFNFVVWRH